MKSISKRERLLATSIIAGFTALGAAGMAHAQESETTQVQDIVVTGSRIVRQDYNAPSPVTTVTAETIELTSTLSVENLLNQLPSVVAGNMATSNNSGGESFATVDLRGLGTSRTLVIVNGERVPASSTTGVVDINSIPSALINRVEVVTGGASAVYGSDAVAGVVNFVLKDDYEGAEISASYAQSFDGYKPEFTINGLIGGNFANGRGNMTAYASYYSREGVSQGDVPFASVSRGVAYTADGRPVVVGSAQEYWDAVAGGGGNYFSGGSGTSAWGTIYNNGNNPFAGLGAAVAGAGNTNFLAGNYDVNCDGVANTADYNAGNLSFDTSGKLTPFAGSGGCTVPDRAAGSSRYNYGPDNYLILPSERFNISTVGHYDFENGVRLDLRLNYANTWQEVSLAPTPATGLVVNLTPAMQDLIQTKHADLWAALQTRADPLAPFNMDRRTNELGPRLGETKSSALSMIGTLSGDFGDSGWDWSLTASYGKNQLQDNGKNSANKTAFFQGLSGCQDPTSGASLGSNALPGCVPLDIFGEGTLTQEMVNFLTVPTFSTTDIEESRLAAFVRGSLMTLPAGDLAAVFGVEWRESRASFQVDNEQRAGNIYGFNAIQDQNGSVSVTELYGELSVPLLRDLPAAKYLGLDFGYRYSDYSTVGGLDTYKVGLEYEPLDWLKFRTVFNSAVRAPSIFELFQNGDQGFPSVIDPCMIQGGQAPSGALANLCNLQAPAIDFTTGLTQANSQTEAFAFGNPDLKPESAETFTIGAVFQPKSFPIGNFRATIDYYDIEITDIIASLGASYWVNSCYSGLDINSTACSKVFRDQVTGQLDYVNTSRVNGGFYRTKGYDTQIDWSVDLADYGWKGRLAFNELLTIVKELNFDGDDDVGNAWASIGGASFDWKSVLSVTYDIGDWTLFGRWSYTPELNDVTFTNAFDDTVYKTPAASYVDFSARWNVTDSLQLTAFIGNVFDKTAPLLPIGVYNGQANTDVQIYYPGLFGRNFSISARAKF
ncbi:TonB-dependent receptor [uncultured Brevundimonas sp.]|uniref:TonB-dependent receptor plug domain-containing protein n=1 Tax=uncultured Brevundimonas sp. TaxID=213418 RepID=UPI0026282B62|nr:TonB-dependent receptor [uncultured Brevundimonas sp.]